MDRATSHKALLASSITVGTVIILVFAKTIAYIFSDAASVLSSLVDSIADIGMSLMTWLSIRWSMMPADDNHRHGHGKIEGVIALFQSAILVGSAAFLLFTAIGRFIQPHQIQDHLFSIGLMVLSGAASMVLTFVQHNANKEAGSLALEADKAHYATDGWMCAIVVVVLLLDYLGVAPVWFDPLATIVIAGIFMYTAAKITRGAMDMLLDREVDKDIKDRILALITAPDDVKGVHDLRCTRSGMKMFVTFDLEVDQNLLLWSAHEIAQEAEYRILKEFPQAEIMIHLDPEGDTADSRHGDIVA